jgi:hypothetical protein
MSEKTLKQLVGALVVAAALWGVTLLLRGDGDASLSASGEIATFFDGVSQMSVSRVHMAGPTGETELAGGPDDWTANGFQADSATMVRFWGAVLSVRVGVLTASNPANHDRMGVSAESAASIEFDVDGETRTILLGNSGPRFSTSYVRLPDSDDVYILEGDLRTHARRLPAEWRNKRVVKADTSAFARVAIEREGDSYTLVRGDSTWTFEDGSPTNASTVRGVMSEFTSLLAVGFLEEGDSLAVAEQGGITTAYDASGNVVAEVTIGSGESDRWARASGDDVIYRIGSFRVNRITPTRESMEPGS